MVGTRALPTEGRVGGGGESTPNRPRTMGIRVFFRAPRGGERSRDTRGGEGRNANSSRIYPGGGIEDHKSNQTDGPARPSHDGVSGMQYSPTRQES